MAPEGVASLRPNYRPQTLPGGIEFDVTTYNQAALRAEMVEVANQISFQHGPKIVDAILKRFNVKYKSLKERK